MKKIIILFVLMMLSVSLHNAAAQSRTSYFVRNSTQNNELNAAFAPDQGYIGFPFLSGVNFQIGSNLGVSNFLFPLSNGSTGLFLNSEVAPEEFLSGIRKSNLMGINLNYKLVDAGWYTGKDSFWTLSFGIKADVEASLPGELFRFAKLGMYDDPSSYSIRDMGVSGQVYGQIALGYSQGLDKWVKGLRIGGKVKVLASMMDVQADVSRLDLNMSSQSWSVKSNAVGHILGGGLNPVFDENGHVNGFRFNPSSLGVAGFGAAFDLGVEYTISEGTPVDGMRFSLSVTDLGFISYGKDKSTLLSADGNEFVYDGLDGIGLDTDFNETLSTLGDELLTMVSFSELPVTKEQVRMMTATLYAGVDYSFLKDKMNVGLLYSARFGRFRTENELTLAWNYAPTRAFDIALSYSLLRTHSTIGWLMTVTPRRGIGIFFGSDFTPVNYTALKFSGVDILEGVTIPVPKKEFFLDVHFGVTISLGGGNSRYESAW